MSFTGVLSQSLVFVWCPSLIRSACVIQFAHLGSFFAIYGQTIYADSCIIHLVHKEIISFHVKGSTMLIPTICLSSLNVVFLGFLRGIFLMVLYFPQYCKAFLILPQEKVEYSVTSQYFCTIGNSPIWFFVLMELSSYFWPAFRKLKKNVFKLVKIIHFLLS